MMTTDDYLERTEVRIERAFDASPARVYHAWTDPGMLSRWVWPGLGKDVWAESDLRVYTNHPRGRHQGEGFSGMCGLFVEIAKDQELVYRFHCDADVGYNQGDQLALDEVVSATLSPDGDGTQMVFVHRGIPDHGQSAGAHHAADCQLERLVRRRTSDCRIRGCRVGCNHGRHDCAYCEAVIW